jgi:large subunit ribosomal protein L28
LKEQKLLTSFRNNGVFLMPKQCQVTGKRPTKGRSYTTRGIAKKKKGIGLKTTGIKKRRFVPNLLKKKLWFAEENRFVSLRLSAAALRTIDKVGLSAVIRKMRKEGKSV